MTQPPTASDLCLQARAHREEILYRTLFGGERRGLFSVAAEMFTTVFGQTELDPHWTQSGVFEFAPTERRASWVYVTSGLSDEWSAREANPDGPAGSGGEFVLELPFQAKWAVTRLLYLMAYQLLVCAGRYPDDQPLGDYEQIPLGTPIGAEPSALTFVMFAPPVGFPRRQTGRTGWFDFFQVVGISEAEAAAARVHGGPLLVRGLQQEGAFPVTIPERKSIL